MSAFACDDVVNALPETPVASWFETQACPYA